MIFRPTNKKGAQPPLMPEQAGLDQAFLAQATQ